MNGTNVDYYASGFDAEGKRVGSLICDFDPTKEKNADKLAAFKGKAKELFDGVVIVDIITAEDYNLYLTGDYIRGAAGPRANGRRKESCPEDSVTGPIRSR